MTAGFAGFAGFVFLPRARPGNRSATERNESVGPLTRDGHQKPSKTCKPSSEEST